MAHNSKLLDCVMMQGDHSVGAHFSRDFHQKAPFARPWRWTGIQPGRLSLCQRDTPSWNTTQQSYKGNFNSILRHLMTKKGINGLRINNLFFQMTHNFVPSLNSLWSKSHHLSSVSFKLSLETQFYRTLQNGTCTHTEKDVNY